MRAAEMRITYGKPSRKEEKRRKQNYVGEKRQEAVPNVIRILIL